MSIAADNPRKALGKGLSSLLPTRQPPPESAFREQNQGKLPLEVIEPNPMQPRTIFNAEALEELAASIRVNGIIQPLIVRRVGETFQIVAGERRWRAAKLADLR